MLSDLGFDTIAIDLFGVDAKLENRDDYKRETGALYKDRTEFRAPLSAADDAGIKSGTNSEKSLSSAIALAVPPHLRWRALDLRLMAL